MKSAKIAKILKNGTKYDLFKEYVYLVTCPYCGIVKELTELNVDKKTYICKCSNCQKEYKILFDKR